MPNFTAPCLRLHEWKLFWQTVQTTQRNHPEINMAEMIHEGHRIRVLPWEGRGPVQHFLLFLEDDAPRPRIWILFRFWVHTGSVFSDSFPNGVFFTFCRRSLASEVLLWTPATCISSLAGLQLCATAARTRQQRLALYEEQSKVSKLDRELLSYSPGL